MIQLLFSACGEYFPILFIDCSVIVYFRFRSNNHTLLSAYLCRLFGLLPLDDCHCTINASVLGGAAFITAPYMFYSKSSANAQKISFSALGTLAYINPMPKLYFTC